MKTLGIAVAAVAVAVALLVGLPPVFGFIAKGQIEDGVAELSVLGLDAEVVDYERGWFRSRAKLSLDTAPALTVGIARQGLAVELLGERPVVIVDLAHGPIAMLDGVSVGTSRFVARFDPAAAGIGDAQERLGVPYLLDFRGRIDFFGKLSYDADVPAFDMTTGPRDLFAFGGLDVEGTYSRGRLVAAGESESLAVVSGNGTLSFDSLSLDVDHDLVDSVGDSSISIGRGTFVDAFGTRTFFAASGLRLASSSAAGTRPERQRISLGLTADTLDVADWNVTAAELALRLRDVDSTVIEQLKALLASGNSVRLEPLVEKLLAAGLEAEIDPLRFRVDNEAFAATVRVRTTPGASPPLGGVDSFAAFMWLNAIEGAATLEVAKPLATRIGALVAAQQQPTFGNSLPLPQRRQLAEAQVGLMLATLMAQGIIVENGDNYRVEVGVWDGSVTVNGQRLF